MVASIEFNSLARERHNEYGETEFLEPSMAQLHSSGQNERLLLVNLTRDLRWPPSAEPLIAPVPHTQWKIMFSSEAPRYGDSGTALPILQIGTSRAMRRS